MGERVLKVFVIIDDPTSDPPEFRLICPHLMILPHTKHDFFFENTGKDDDGFLLRYTLTGNTYGYSFPKNKDKALYSREGPGCPDSPGQWEQFFAKKVESRKVLIVRNCNEEGHEGEFGYTLRLTKKPDDETVPPNEYLNLDPGGFNGNGHGRKNISAATFVLAIAVGVVSALVTVFSLIGLKIIQ